MHVVWKDTQNLFSETLLVLLFKLYVQHNFDNYVIVKIR